jgi:O-antigen/teichoic acid export membrane protein
MKRNFLQNSEFLRHTFQLLVGTSIVQGLGFVLQPVLSRLFTASDYAVYGVFITMLNWLEIVATGRYELATVIPKHDRDAVNLVAGTSLLSLVVALLTLSGTMFFGTKVCSLFNVPALLPYLYLLPFTLFIWSVSKMLNSWLVRKEAFKAYSVNKMAQKGSEFGSSITFGAISIHGGLIIGDFIGRTMLFLVSLRQSIQHGASMSMVSFREMTGVMKRLYRYPFYNTLPALLNTTATLLPVLFMSSRYPGDAAGNFIFSRMVLLVPISFLSFSISQVLLQKVAKNRIGNLSVRSEIYFLVRYLGFIGLAILIVFLVAAPQIFTFVFGKRWLLAGTFSQVMVVSYAIQFLVSPISSALAAMEKIKLYSIWQTCYFLAVGGLYFVKGISAFHFIVLLTVVEALSYSVYLILILWGVGKYEYSIKSEPGKSFDVNS